MNAKTSRMIGYYRVSTAQQGLSGLGLEAQQASVNEYVRGAGCDLLAAYTEVETGTKRGTDNRPELKKAMAHAKRAKATLVIAKLDRLSRNVCFLSGLMEAKVNFVAVDMPTADNFQVHIMVALAEKEAQMTSERTKRAFAAKKARGEKMGTNNLTIEGGIKGRAAAVAAIRKNKAEAYAYIAPIIADLGARGLSLRAIAASLDEMGETTRTGKPWNAKQVARVLGCIAPTA